MLALFKMCIRYYDWYFFGRNFCGVLRCCFFLVGAWLWLGRCFESKKSETGARFFAQLNIFGRFSTRLGCQQVLGHDF